jgi:SAM-dependent methyltransferase
MYNKPTKQLMNAAKIARIRYLSSPTAVSIGDDWYGVATLEHFWTRRRFEVLRRMAPGLMEQASEVAEVGCGHGLLQRQIEDYYHRHVTGFDLNDVALQQSVSRTSPVCCYDVLEQSPEYKNRFDVIFLFDVLEHIRDEASFLRAAQYHLAPAGKLVINVPAMPSMYSKFDREVGHFRRYNPESLRRVAERSGMTVAVWSYWGLPLTPLLVLRKFWLARLSREGVIAAGFGNRGPVTNRLLLSLSRWEPIPQRMLGTALMALFEKPA